MAEEDAALDSSSLGGSNCSVSTSEVAQKTKPNSSGAILQEQVMQALKAYVAMMS